MTIRRRLALGYAAAIAVTLALAGAMVWLEFGSNLRAALDQTLAVRAAAAATALENQDGQVGLQEGDLRTPTPIWLALYDPSGRLTDLSSGAPAALEGAAIPRGSQIRLGGATYAIHAAKASDGTLVVAGSPMEPVDRPLGELARLLLSVAIVGGAASAATGWWLAGRALRPVVALTGAAESIDPGELERRLPVPRRRDELADLATTMNALLERTESTVRRQRLFVASASHDLRTPIAALQVELELADDPSSTREDLLAAIRNARGDVAALTNLASGLLDLASAEPGGRRLVRVDVELVDLVAACLRRVEPVARANGVEISVDVQPATVRLDRVRMEQALSNLLVNAVTHAASGGEVEVRTECAADASGNAYLAIDVMDRGPGIAADARARIFEPFELGRSSAGSGLGLATAAAAVRAHGGSIGVESRPGGGSDFWIRVPLQPDRGTATLVHQRRAVLGRGLSSEIGG